jgi:SAM-dependent methyltransferase
MGDTQLTYSQLVQYRDHFPLHWHYPVLRVKDGKSWVAEQLKECRRLLDIGCGARLFLTDYLIPKGFDGRYVGVDTDPDVHPDYRDVLAIPDHERFDSAVLLNIVEHVPAATFLSWLEKLRTILMTSGRIFIIVPNNLHFQQMFCDFTHTQFYPLPDLCSILKAHGFVDIRGYRVAFYPYHPNRLKRGLKWMIRGLRAPIARWFLESDLNCINLMVEARNP